MAIISMIHRLMRRLLGRRFKSFMSTIELLQDRLVTTNNRNVDISNVGTTTSYRFIYKMPELAHGTQLACTTRFVDSMSSEVNSHMSCSQVRSSTFVVEGVNLAVTAITCGRQSGNVQNFKKMDPLKAILLETNSKRLYLVENKTSTTPEHEPWDVLYSMLYSSRPIGDRQPRGEGATYDPSE